MELFHIFLLVRQLMEIEQSGSVHLLIYYKRLFRFRPAAFLPSRHSDLIQSTLPDLTARQTDEILLRAVLSCAVPSRAVPCCAVLSCAVLC